MIQFKMNSLPALLMTALAFVSMNHVSEAADRRVEVPVANALIPGSGYDDNDTVEAVITGELPNPCFKLADIAIERVGQQFRLHQYAWLRTDGPCGSGDLIDDAVPFATDASLGRLPQGAYQIAFNPDLPPGPTALNLHTKSFSIEAATVGQIDTFNYAAITNVEIRDIHPLGAPIEVTLSGLIGNRCTRVVEPIQVKKLNDVFVILPIVEAMHGRNCIAGRENYQVKVSLGTPTVGEYLVHVRSRNGKAVQKVFEVTQP